MDLVAGTLHAWMGHKRIDETMRHVHLASEHPRPCPAAVLSVAVGEVEPDRRVPAVLGARGNLTATEQAEDPKQQQAAARRLATPTGNRGY